MPTWSAILTVGAAMTVLTLLAIVVARRVASATVPFGVALLPAGMAAGLAAFEWLLAQTAGGA
ncbi:hypothetical protein ACWC9R_28325 [Streptomyces sp. NPDC001219]